MKEKIENINFKYKVTLFTFILFLIIEALSPISGDDWHSYVIGKEGFINSIENINILDGRIISGFLINFFSYNKILFDLSFALLISQFVKMCNNLIGTVNNKYYYLYPLIGILLVSVFTFSYNYVSVTSTIAYTFPSIAFISYFYNLLKGDELDNKMFIKLFLLSVYICLSSVHLAMILLIANIAYFLMRKRNNKIEYLLIIFSNILLLTFSLSLVEGNLFYFDTDSIRDNIPYFIENVFSNNIILIILGAIPINMYLYQKLKDHTYVRVVITLFDLVLILSLSYNFFNYSPVNLNLILSKYRGNFATENWYFILYFVTYIILFMLSINYLIKNKRLKEIFNVFIISSIVMSVFMLISPIFDRGNVILIILSLIMIICVVAKETNAKVFTRITRIVISLLVVYYISMFAVIKYIDITRNDYIKEQTEADSQVIEVKANPTYYIWRYNPIDYFQIKDFKEYYNIPTSKTIDVKYFGVFEKVEKSIKE